MAAQDKMCRSALELAPMELPIGSPRIHVTYLTNPTFCTMVAGEVGELSYEEELTPRSGPHTLITKRLP